VSTAADRRHSVSRVLITGSADGLGLLAARRLIAEGHHVVLHARSNARAHDALHRAPEAVAALIADLSLRSEVVRLANQAQRFGPFDAVIHNAAVGPGQVRRVLTEDGVSEMLAVNVLAPYLLTALMEPPSRAIYISSALHRRGELDLSDLSWRDRAWDGRQAYADSKLLVSVLAMAVARRRPRTVVNVVEPGWVPTRMGGPAAPEDLHLGADTQAWLAVSEDRAARISGRYLYHRAERAAHPAVGRADAQEALLQACARLTGVSLEGGGDAAPGARRPLAMVALGGASG